MAVYFLNHFNLLMVLQFLEDFLEGYFLQQLYSEFFDSKFQNKWGNGLGVVVLYVAFQYIKKFILPADYRIFHITENLILTGFSLIFLLLCFYQKISGISIFLIISFMAIQETSRIFTLIFPYAGDILTNLLYQYVKNRIIFIRKHIFLFTVLIVNVVWILAYLIRIWVIYFSLKSIKKNFSEKQFPIHSTELKFLLIPGLTSLGITVLLNLIMFRVGENGEQEFLFDIYPVLRLFMPIMLVLSLLSILYGVKLFQDMLLLNRERSSRLVLEKQIESIKEYIKETQRMQSGIRSIKHDMKNTLSIIKQLASENSEAPNTELYRYISGLSQTMNSLESRFKTGNIIVDCLLNMKYQEAICMIPDLKIDVDNLLFPQTLTVESYDIGIIIGNALDNAIDACKKLKIEKPEADVYIKLSCFHKRAMFFLEVENSFHGKLIQKKCSEFPLSDKESGELHGMGLMNIKNAAEKYHGAVKWEVRGLVFVLSIMLKNGKPI